MAELVDAADSKSVFERSGSSSLPRGTNTEKKVLRKQGLFFVRRKVEVGFCQCEAHRLGLTKEANPETLEAWITKHKAEQLALDEKRPAKRPSLYPNMLFFPADLNIVLCFQIGVDAKPIPAVVNDPFTLLLRESLDLSNLPVIGVDVVKLHLKRRMLLDE